jgi:hypothetical protein
MGVRNTRPDILFSTSRPRLYTLRHFVAVRPARNLLHQNESIPGHTMECVEHIEIDHFVQFDCIDIYRIVVGG